jgi:3',5'-cyclic AMP phosphodiesterase CpdA
MCIISARKKVRMDDGTEVEGGPGDTAVIPPGHDASVVGNEMNHAFRLISQVWQTMLRKHN